jgi:endonuclease III
MPGLDALIGRLPDFYGVLPSPPLDAFSLVVWDVLAAHTTPRRRDAAMAALKRIPALTPDAMWRAPKGRLEAAVKLAGAYLDQRLAALQAAVEAFRKNPLLHEALRGPLRGARRSLDALPFLGSSGRERLLLFAGDQVVMPVEPSIARVVTRLGCAPMVPSRRNLRLARRALVDSLPRDLGTYRHAVVYLTHHAGATCTEAEPHCTVCPLRPDCEFGAPHEHPAPGT